MFSESSAPEFGIQRIDGKRCVRVDRCRCCFVLGTELENAGERKVTNLLSYFSADSEKKGVSERVWDNAMVVNPIICDCTSI